MDQVSFGPAGAANSIRGALGLSLRRVSCDLDCAGPKQCARRQECAYARLFEPARIGAGPSGLADWPRPFVLRAAHLDGIAIPAGDTFEFDVHLFETGIRASSATTSFNAAFESIAREGIGPAGERARIESAGEIAPSEVRIDLQIAHLNPESRIRVEFLTPVELKSAGGLVERPDFHILFARARDRVATLRSLYGGGALDVDFVGLGAQAGKVTMESCEITQVPRMRRSSRTGQQHAIGGFVGHAVYSGHLAPFVRWLEAAEWTGVGRHTVWGKGQLRIIRL